MNARLLWLAVSIVLSFLHHVTSQQDGGIVCRHRADIVLVLDQSTSIVDQTYDNWYIEMLTFAANIVRSFVIGLRSTQIALMKFSNEVEVAFHLDDYHDKTAIIEAIMRQDINGGDTNIAFALRRAREEMFSPSNGAREGVAKILFLVTDGSPNFDRPLTVPEAWATKNAGIEIFGIGVTSDVDTALMEQIVSKPIDSHFFYVDMFSQLTQVLQTLVNASCGSPPRSTGSTTTSTTTTPTTTTTMTSTTTTTTPVPTTTTFPDILAECENATVDLVLILDQSSSLIVGEPNYDNWNVNMLQFAISVVQSFRISPDVTQIGLMKFSDDADIVFHFYNFTEVDSIIEVIRTLDIEGGDTNIAGALEAARTEMFTDQRGAREKEKVRELIFLVTDGTANINTERTQDEAQLTKDAGMKSSRLELRAEWMSNS